MIEFYSKQRDAMISSADKWLKGLCVEEEFCQSLLAKQFTHEQENALNLMFLDTEVNVLYIQALAKWGSQDDY